MMVIPGHLIFSYTISYLQAGHTSFTPIFIMIYLIAAMLQVQHILIYINTNYFFNSLNFKKYCD